MPPYTQKIRVCRQRLDLQGDVYFKNKKRLCLCRYTEMGGNPKYMCIYKE